MKKTDTYNKAACLLTEGIEGNTRVDQVQDISLCLDLRSTIISRLNGLMGKGELIDCP